MNEIIKFLESLDGVLNAYQLDPENILKIIDIESKRKKELIPVFNRAIQECFKRDVTIVIFKKGYFRPPQSPTMLLIFDGEILGHDIFTDEDKDRFSRDEDVRFLSDDFIIFEDVLHNHNLEKGNEYLLFPPVPFPELDDFKGICDVVSSSPSTESDEYLKEEFGFKKDSSLATIFVSFNFSDDLKNKKKSPV